MCDVNLYERFFYSLMITFFKVIPAVITIIIKTFIVISVTSSILNMFFQSFN